MIQCWGNFKGGRRPKQCPIFREPSSEDNQEHMMDCKVLKEKAHVDGNYPDIFRKNINEIIARTLVNIASLREEIIEDNQEKSLARPTAHNICVARRTNVLQIFLC